MTKAQVELITSVQRRRRWSRAEKERIVAAALEPGAVALLNFMHPAGPRRRLFGRAGQAWGNRAGLQAVGFGMWVWWLLARQDKALQRPKCHTGPAHWPGRGRPRV
jgi:hypothetical protein